MVYMNILHSLDLAFVVTDSRRLGVSLGLKLIRVNTIYSLKPNYYRVEDQ